MCTHRITVQHQLLYTYLIVFSIDESQLEFVLSWINGEQPGLAVSVQTVDAAALHHGDVDRDIQSANDTMVTRNWYSR